MNHLSTIDQTATVLAHDTSEDIQALRMADGSERLYVDGSLIPLHPQRHHHPVQQVINYCRLSRRDRKTMRKLWLTLPSGGDAG